MKRESGLPLLLMVALGIVLCQPSPSESRTLDADIVVIGAGTAGLPAALEAAEGGARVIVFEKSNKTGGTGNMGMGPFAVETRLQREKQVGITKEEAFDIFMNYTHWRVNARLVKAYIDKSADTVHWLEAMGVEFIEPKAYFPQSKPTWHIVKNPEQKGYAGGGAMSTALKIVADKCKEKGVQFLFETPAKKLIKQGNRITGAIGEDKAGEKVQVNAKAVIIATGGFGNNTDMIRDYTPYEWGVDVFSMKLPGLDGDGIQMAWEAGAFKDIDSMNIELTFGGLTRGGSPAVRQPRAIMVNLHGKRFYNEELMGNTTFTGNAIAAQKKRTGFLIIDSDIAEYYEKNGADTVGSVGEPVWNMGQVDSDMKKAIERGNKGFFIADSLEDLAKQTGMNLAGLTETVGQYNSFCEKGKDALFNKSNKYLMPIKTPKYYAMTVVPSGYGTLGGIRINEKTEVLNSEDEPIPGLYAAGGDANSIYADSYVFILPGNTMGFALNTGRIAGENALNYIGKGK